MKSRFNKNMNEITIDFKIKLKEPMNIGIGTEKDNKKLKEDKNKNFIDCLTIGSKTKEKNIGEVYIPGSSIRGVIRNRLNRLSLITEATEEKRNEFLNSLFGYSDKKRNQKSRIVIEDAFLVDENKRKKMNFENKYDNIMTKINPYTPMKNGKPNILTMNVINKDEEFRSKITIKSVSSKEFFLLLYVFFESLDNKIRIGSNKSRGLGLVELDLININFNINKNENNEYLEEKEIEKYCLVNEEKSIKIGDKYIKKSLQLKAEYLKLEKNDFLDYIERRGVE